MQRVSALLPTWDRSRSSSSSTVSKTSMDKVRGWADKIPSPVNRLSTSRIGKEAFWPATLDKECEKAARILKSFCIDGFSVPDDRPTSPSTTSSNTTTNTILKKIPPRVIENAVGLAVFTSMRSGIWTSGSGGSGIMIARKADGTWSPPSGLMLQTASLRFVLGVDIYDCVVVINTFTMLEAMGRPRTTLGTDVGLTRGPLVTLGLLENEYRWTDLSDTVLTYVKARGQSADVKLEGTVLTERADENERFYGNSFSVPKILAGDINQSLPQLRTLTETLKAAEGRTDFDASLLEQLSSQMTPGDSSVESPTSAGSLSPSFGLPDVEDPDPFGVLALEMAGMEIREAGTGVRPDSSQFEYVPSPTSSTFPRIGRQSVDTYLSRSNRGSYMSNKTMASHLTDAGTQTTPGSTTTTSPSQSDDGKHVKDIPEVREPEEEVYTEPIEVDYTKIDISALRNLSAFPESYDEPFTASPVEEVDVRAQVDDAIEQTSVEIPSNEEEADADDEEDGVSDDAADLDSDSDDDEDFEDAEEAVVYEVATAQPPARLAIVASQAVQVKGAVVTIPRRVPPPLPLRSPARLSRRSKSEFGDVSMISSPLRQEFDLEAQADEATTPRPGEHFEAAESKTENDVVVDEHKSSPRGSTEADRLSTSTKDLVDYFSADHTTSTAAQTAATVDEEADFKAGHGVTVSVA